MRTKALFVAAAFVAAGIVSSMAQVYSVNVVGYVNATLVPGFNLISNPLNAADNKVSALMPKVDGMIVYKFNSTTGEYELSSYLALLDTWGPADFEINPGEGVFVLLPGSENVTVTFVGEITEGAKSIDVPAGFSIRSSIVPQSGALVSALGFPQGDGDIVYKFNTAIQDYELYSYLELLGTWSPSEPNVEVGESFFVSKNAAATWSRNFSVSGQ
jgi:hypothetical protein